MVQVYKTYGSSCHLLGSKAKAAWSFLIRERKRRHFTKGEQMSVRVSHRMYSALYRRTVAGLTLGSLSTHQSFISLRGKKIKLPLISHKCTQFSFENPNGVLLA